MSGAQWASLACPKAALSAHDRIEDHAGSVFVETELLPEIANEAATAVA
jgi:hypothetical protein